MKTAHILLGLAVLGLTGTIIYYSKKDEKAELLMLIELDKTDSAETKARITDIVNNKMTKQEISDTYKMMKAVMGRKENDVITPEIKRLRQDTAFQYRLSLISKKYNIFT